MDKPTKSKAAKKVKPKAVKKTKRKSLDSSLVHKKIVQDRITGATLKELIERYGLDRKRVWKICDDHAEEIEKGREDILSDRQDLINKALNNDTERFVDLLNKSTGLLERLFDETLKSIDFYTENSTEVIKLNTVFNGLDMATKAFDRIRAAAHAQQKLATGNAEST